MFIYKSFLLLILYITSVQCFIVSSGIGVAVSAIVYTSYKYFKCYKYECCTDDYIHKNFSALSYTLKKELYGQPIAKRIVFSAVTGHLTQSNPRKPLVMSFHGMPGTGKNYVVQMIAQALYTKGVSSSFFHFYNGRNDFPEQHEVYKYKERLRDEITKALEQCEHNLFVFDEVDKMPEGILNVLVPYIDYADLGFQQKNINKNKSIFIFLSNTGSRVIVRQMLDLWRSGRKNREDMTLQDFENLISKGAFNEKGGLYLSETIETSLIDHYVPFLPLEETHVVDCIKHAYMTRNVSPSEDMIQNILSHLTFGPEPENIYSESGCKRIEQKVTANIIMDKHDF